MHNHHRYEVGASTNAGDRIRLVFQQRLLIAESPGFSRREYVKDGNKRIGMLVMLMTLRLNHVQIRYTQSELIQLGLSVADSSFRYEDILAWINEHK